MQEGEVQAAFMANSDVLEWGDIDYKEIAVIRALLEGKIEGKLWFETSKIIFNVKHVRSLDWRSFL